jgi:hypothetical protein
VGVAVADSQDLCAMPVGGCGRSCRIVPRTELRKQGTATDGPQCMVYLQPNSSDRDDLHPGLSYSYSAGISGWLEVESRSTYGRRVNHVARSLYLSAPHRRSRAFLLRMRVAL